MAIMVVIRSGRWPDEGAVINLGGYLQAWRFASDWQTRHPYDRLSIFSPELRPLVALDADQRGNAQPGNRASGTLS
jgi:hypothetical protein